MLSPEKEDARHQLQDIFRSRLGPLPQLPSADEADDGYDVLDLETARMDRVIEASLLDAWPCGWQSPDLGMPLNDPKIASLEVSWTGGVTLPASLVCLICSFSDYGQLLDLRRVLPASAVPCVQSVLHNKEYIRHSAYLGFDNPVDPNSRFRIW